MFGLVSISGLTFGARQPTSTHFDLAFLYDHDTQRRRTAGEKSKEDSNEPDLCHGAYKELVKPMRGRRILICSFTLRSPLAVSKRHSPIVMRSDSA